MGAVLIIAVVVPVAVIALLVFAAVFLLWRHKEETSKTVDHTALAKRWFVWNQNQDLPVGKNEKQGPSKPPDPKPAPKLPIPLQSVVVTTPTGGRSVGETLPPRPQTTPRDSPRGDGIPRPESGNCLESLNRPDIANRPETSPRVGVLPRPGMSPREAANQLAVSSRTPWNAGSASPESVRSLGASSADASAVDSPRARIVPLNHGGATDWLSSRSFTLREILVATNYFNPKLELGSGGFGKVYHGQLRDGGTVAIKRMKKESKQGMREFINEVRLLGRLRHVNLVQLVGFCATEEEQLLCYEYMPNGNLAQHLRGTKKPLSWRMRLEVAIGAAKGLDYLHVIATPPVIHRDVKSSNILLDEDWNAKVADFGLSKAVPMNSNVASSSTFVRGTPGYFDPEYYEGQRLTEKSDVYAFGVVLLEMLTGKKPIDETLPLSDGSLAKWARPHLRDPERAVSLVDPRIQGSMTRASVLKFASLALNCIALSGDERPSMSEVVLRLQEAIAS